MSTDYDGPSIELRVLQEYFGISTEDLSEIYDDKDLMELRKEYTDQQPVVDALSYLKPEYTDELTPDQQLRDLRKRFNVPGTRT